MSKWRVMYKCWADNCQKELTWDEVLNSHGVCPHCGMNSRDAIVRHSQHSVKFVRDYPQWMFWRTKGRLIFK
ncbi:hypothetical protein LCGC14_2288770 [marine sediment metagenome]|uniref:C2H2-type domain-containing protein n=1 Tax=marine sediment metagenome TaxID=412755 RepID=A0A0F9DEF7_9ZZZZ